MNYPLSPVDHQKTFKPHRISQLKRDDDGRLIVEAEENEQPAGSGLLIYGSLCPGCHTALWLSFVEGQDFGLYDHSCGARLRYIKKPTTQGG